MKTIHLALVALLYSGIASANPCASAEHRAFDFWVGDWKVTSGGKVAGENRIERRHGGCVLHESYVTPKGYAGESINIYDARRKVWHQTWADTTGLLLILEGGMRDGSMVMEGTSTTPQGKSQRQRMSWTPNPDGSVRQLWEVQDEKGEWKTSFDGRYERK